MARILCIGEAMLELTRAGDQWQLGYGGDTLNTGIHLARFNHDVAYVTALGADPFSADLRTKWGGEGLDTDLILTDPARNPGLYAISVDAQGERSFAYWRNDSAARQMFDLPGFARIEAAVMAADAIVYSLITLAILPPPSRDRLIALCQRARAAGVKVAFDGNYRPRLWPDAATARAARDAAIACADIGLPTLDDERLIGGPDSAEAVAAHWQTLGCPETIVKLGPEGCRLPDGTIVAPPEVLQPIDTSGAGDAFNGGYLAARMNGAAADAAALTGHRVAGWVVMRTGAIPAPYAAAPYA